MTPLTSLRSTSSPIGSVTTPSLTSWVILVTNFINSPLSSSLLASSEQPGLASCGKNFFALSPVMSTATA